MKIYNTLSRKKDAFDPLTPGHVRMYTCGQTVYNDIHIGNARFYVVFDAIRRYMEYKGYAVNYVQNFTDVDDKIIARAAQEGVSSPEIAERYIQHTLEDLDALNVKCATVHPKATEEIPAILDMVQALIDKGFAYVKNGTVFFATRRVKAYGKLSRKNPDDLEAGARVDINADKLDPTDFVLWKPAKPDEPYWPSPWGNGRPGWHIECSAMAKKYLGDTIDIHGGAADLIFPHHENEIAQSEAANNAPFSRNWMHCGILTVDHKKMSKSAGNFHTLREVAELFEYDVIRFFLVSGHYRMPMEYGEHLLESAQSALNRIKNCRAALRHKALPADAPAADLPAEARVYRQAFEQAMDDDFNTADAIAAIFDMVKHINTSRPKGGLARAFADELDALCGILGVRLEGIRLEGINLEAHTPEAADQPSDAEIEALIAARGQAREAKNWAESDRIRDLLLAKGIRLTDTREGVVWTRL
jgi:cysteinyl-tRNA synthetase